FTDWHAGAEIRPVFGVRSREPGQKIDALLEEIAYEPLGWKPADFAFTERFDAAILDPERWNTQLGDERLAHGSLRLGRGALDLEGRAPDALRAGSSTAVALLSRPTSLESFRVTVRFQVEKLDKAALYLGIGNLAFGLPDWRIFDCGTQVHPGGREAY